MGQEIDYYDLHIIVKEHPKVQKYEINLFKIIKNYSLPSVYFLYQQPKYP